MTDVKKIAIRDSYGNALVELETEHSGIVVFDTDLATATKTGVFKKVFPECHFDCGIEKSNMVAVVAGVSTMGSVPFVSNFSMFVAGPTF